MSSVRKALASICTMLGLAMFAVGFTSIVAMLPVLAVAQPPWIYSVGRNGAFLCFVGFLLWVYGDLLEPRQVTRK